MSRDGGNQGSDKNHSRFKVGSGYYQNVDRKNPDGYNNNRNTITIPKKKPQVTPKPQVNPFEIQAKQKAVQAQKKKEFVNSGKVDNPFLILKPLEGLAKKGSVYSRTFFSDKVLSKKGVSYKGTKYSKLQFENLSVTKQNEIYGDYYNKRMQGGTDAYGNILPGWREDSKGNLIQTADADPVIKKNEKQVETESKKIIEKEEEKKDEITEEEKEENYKKIKGLKGARSMFGNAGGRGYFDPT